MDTDCRLPRGPLTAVLVLFSLAASAAATKGNPIMERDKAKSGPAAAPAAKVDASTMRGKVLCGYQGWFTARGDSSGSAWVHYGSGGRFEPGRCTVDLWPDMSEMDADEKFATPFKHKDGSTAYVFSPHVRKTVARHFAWMREYGLDGVFLQRFAVSVREGRSRGRLDAVLANVRAGANEHGRVWAVMYDLSGLRKGQIRSVLMPDWKHLRDDVKVTADPRYLHHNGKPVVAVWGVGFNDGRAYTLEECGELVDFLKTDPRYGGQTVMLGVPTYWRTRTRDAIDSPLLHKVILQADVVSPWTVGRYRTPAQAAAHGRDRTAPDLKWCADHGKEYLPVVFPGFSWRNLMAARGRRARLDQIPRRKGEFLWSQYLACKRAGARMVYQAMFDEIDEGTAIFKCTNDPPVGASRFVTYEGLPSDFYLQLVGQGRRLIRGEIPATEKVPALP